MGLFKVRHKHKEGHSISCSGRIITAEIGCSNGSVQLIRSGMTKFIYNRCPLMCEGRREIDGQNIL